VHNPVSKKKLRRLRCRPFIKKNTEAVKKNRNVASLKPDFEKKRKNSVVIKSMMAYRASRLEYNIRARKNMVYMVRTENIIDNSGRIESCGERNLKKNAIRV
jgi:hypothetical protein